MQVLKPSATSLEVLDVQFHDPVSDEAFFGDPHFPIGEFISGLIPHQNLWVGNAWTRSLLMIQVYT